MKNIHLSKIFVGVFIFTILSFSVAGYATKQAKAANPQVVDQLAKHFNVHINTSDSGFSILASDEANYEAVSKTWDFESSARSLHISAKSVDITFVKSADDMYHVTAKGFAGDENSKDLLTAEIHGQEIFISDEGKKVKDVALTVQVPEKKLRSLRSNSVSGDFSWKEVAADEIHIVTISGDISITKAAIQWIEVKSVSGDIDLENTNEGRIEARSTSGDIKIHSPNFQNAQFDLKSVSGEITNPFGGKKDSATKVTASTVSGDIKVQ